MRDLKFIVTGQNVKKDTSCDFRNVVRGSNDYLRLSFTFDHEWNEAAKVIELFDDEGNSYPYLLKNNSISIMDNVTKGEYFSLIIHAKKGTQKFKTNKVRIMQV